MYCRYAEPFLQSLLTQFPAVVLLGPRQAGKTTLAFAAKKRIPMSITWTWSCHRHNANWMTRKPFCRRTATSS